MFFRDKYSPKTPEESLFHKEEIEKLKKMSEDESVTHIIFYGPQGCGKKTVLNMFLEMMYNKEVKNPTETVYTVYGSGNTPHEVPIKQSNYHIVIEPNNNNFDRYIIQDVVNAYAKLGPLNVFTSKKSFKTVVINNIDNMSYYAQTSLRRTMEKYSKTCRFIMWSRSLSKVRDPIRSRCHCFKLKAPTNSEIFEMLVDIAAKENIKMSLEDYQQMILKADGNIKTALWALQLKQLNEPFVTTYDNAISFIVDRLLTTDIRHVLAIRDKLYNIMITNISGTTIIKDVTERLLYHQDVPFKCKLKIPEIAAKYEHNLIRGRRDIMHLEPFVAAIMKNLSIKQ